MNFLGLGPGELFVVMVLALIVFGPQKLPEIGKGLGKAIGEFRRATNDITQEFNRELQLDSILNPNNQQAAPPQKQQAAEPAVRSSSSTTATAMEELPRSEPIVGGTAPEKKLAPSAERPGEGSSYQREEAIAPSPAEEPTAPSGIEEPPTAEAEESGDKKQESGNGEIT